MQTDVFAPAKINLTLHVTDQRADGYHLLDSLVVFADICDRLRLEPASKMGLAVMGPMAEGVPTDASNLCWRAADSFGEMVQITLEKHLPSAAGIGGGSSDAAAILRGMERIFGRPYAGDAKILGADVPVCLAGRSMRMEGIGEKLTPVSVPEFPAILVNPGVAVPTGAVFNALPSKQNSAMDVPEIWNTPTAFLTWLHQQRNDLQAPAIAQQPVIGAVLDTLENLPGQQIARMSGSGATCFALFDSEQAAQAGAAQIAAQAPSWWVKPCHLGGASRQP